MTPDVANGLTLFNPFIQQEIRRKYMEPKNLSLEEKHYTHIGDNESNDDDIAIYFRFPRDKPFRNFSPGEVFKVPNDEYKKTSILRANSHVKELFPPYNLRDQNLIQYAEALENPENDRNKIIEELREIAPRINSNLMADFCLYLALYMKVDDPELWKIIEKSILEEINVMTFHDLCKINFAVTNINKVGNMFAHEHALEGEPGRKRTSRDLERAI